MATNNKTYAELKSELDDVLFTLQQDNIDVDDALKTYEKGMELVAKLESQLKEAEIKIVKLKARFDN